MIAIQIKGDFSKTASYLKKLKSAHYLRILDKYGQQGVDALSAATPVDTGLTASSWNYKIEKGNDTIKLVFNNTNVHNGVPIAIILQYGHGTGTGGWVEGRDYINPAIQPIFERIAEKVCEEVRML